ncbi:MAG: LysM peptidoglycan-binding domain-containing protein [Oscillospiraceae bacterium]|nr:LysM peptidoglycan-binding domain-containing protein [Oscillospiraceae bacterium]
MKKNAKILSLFIALFMILALSLPTLAYETDGLFDTWPTLYYGAAWNIPPDQWTVYTIYHWVVRGDTLPDIAKQYGTTVDLIVENNWDYFKDLELRNKTTTLNIQLENGVRLKIYDVITVTHYVRRGDTLNDLAYGGLKLYSWWYHEATQEIILNQNRLIAEPDLDPIAWPVQTLIPVEWQYNLRTIPSPNSNPPPSGMRDVFELWTTPNAIRNENADWFRNLDLLNITQDENVPLVESNNIFAYYRGFVSFNGWTSHYEPWTNAGSPLHITVPIKYYYDRHWPQIRYGTWAYLRDYSETDIGGLDPLMAAQVVFGNSVPSIDAVTHQIWVYNQELKGWELVDPTVTFDSYNWWIAWPNLNPIGNYLQGWSLNQALLGSEVPGVGPNVGDFDAPRIRIERLNIPGFGEYQPWQNYVSLRK